MASANKLQRISPTDLDDLLAKAGAERWSELVLLGPSHWLSEEVDRWPDELKAASQVFQLTAPVEALATKLLSLTSIASLYLQSNNIDSDGAKTIAHLANLTLLDLSNNEIGYDGAKAIAASLTNLTLLDLSNNRIGDDGAKAIAASLTNLTSLNLSNNEIGDDSAKAIAASLTNLTSLNLRVNQIGADGAKAVANLANLTSLNLGINKIGDDGAKAIANLANLTGLDLVYNQIGADGAKAIAASLTNLTLLDLQGNKIGVDGAKAIAASRARLTSLSLYDSNIGTDGAKAVAGSLTKLTSLVLSENNIGTDGAKAIAASLTNLTSLYLQNENIGADGATAIAASLTNLTSLRLVNNNIGADGAKPIANLTNLTLLDLSNNEIGDDDAKAIAASLTNLTLLGLSYNEIGDDGAKAIAASLTNLTSLNLSNNRIGDDGAKAITALTNLTSLSLNKNNIGAEGAKAITALTNLTSLSLNENNIGAEGAKAILEAWSPASRTGQLRWLDLSENGNFGDLLPKEVLETSDAQAILAAYRRYRIADEQKTLRPLNEAKLLVVGNEAVGKTSLLRYLIKSEPRDPSEKKTPGIATHEQIETRTWSPERSLEQHSISLNVWDFGGQEIMRGTHRFFLTERSLYLLVLEDRRQDDEPVAENWLKIILNRGGDSPIVIVINKSDSGKEDLRLNEAGLQRTYPNIVAFLRTSCEADDWARDSIEALRYLIAKTVAEHPQLKHVRDSFPGSYLRVKQTLTGLARERTVLSFSRFEKLCERDDADGEAITDPDEQRALLRLLHDLGVVVAHGLERDAPAAIRGITLLDPNWLTGAIYKLLNEPRLRDQDGEFERRQMNQWLDPTLYPSERHEFVLAMMQDPEIGLCFRLPDAADERYLVPEALPANEPDYDSWPGSSLRFRFVYRYLPPGLIPRFIVQAHRNLTEKKTRWRTGAVLTAANCRILISGNLDRRRIDIAVDGPEDLQRSALNVVLDDLDFVHELNPESGPEARVPLPDRPEMDVGYEHLQKLQERECLDYEFYPEGADRAYTVRELLEGRKAQDQVTTPPDPPTPPHPLTPTWERVAIFAVGIVFVVILLSIALFVPNPTIFQMFVFRSVLALAAGAVGALIPGLLDVRFKGWLRAGGAMALFVLVYSINPPQLIVESVQPAATVVD